MVEIWQADAGGLFAGREGADPNFTGWGRSAGDPETGTFRFETVKPGRVTWPDGRLQAYMQACGSSRAASILGCTRASTSTTRPKRTWRTRSFRIDQAARLPILLAKRTAPGVYRFDVHLQGPNETIFFDI